MMAGISRARFDQVKERAPQKWPELEVDTPRGVFEVDRSLREQGQQPTSLGLDLEGAWLTATGSPDETLGTQRGAFFGDLGASQSPFRRAEQIRLEETQARNARAPQSISAASAAGHTLGFLGGSLGSGLLPEGSPRFLNLAVEEGLRPANYAMAGVRGLSFAPKAAAGVRAGVEVAAALGGRAAREGVTSLTGSEGAGEAAGFAGNIAIGLSLAKSDPAQAGKAFRAAWQSLTETPLRTADLTQAVRKSGAEGFERLNAQLIDAAQTGEPITVAGFRKSTGTPIPGRGIYYGITQEMTDLATGGRKGALAVKELVFNNPYVMNSIEEASGLGTKVTAAVQRAKGSLAQADITAVEREIAASAKAMGHDAVVFRSGPLTEVVDLRGSASTLKAEIVPGSEELVRAGKAAIRALKGEFSDRDLRRATDALSQAASGKFAIPNANVRAILERALGKNVVDVFDTGKPAQLGAKVAAQGSVIDLRTPESVAAARAAANPPTPGAYQGEGFGKAAPIGGGPEQAGLTAVQRSTQRAAASRRAERLAAEKAPTPGVYQGEGFGKPATPIGGGPEVGGLTAIQRVSQRTAATRQAARAAAEAERIAKENAPTGEWRTAKPPEPVGLNAVQRASQRAAAARRAQRERAEIAPIIKGLSFGESAVDLLSVPRTLRATGDFTATLRHGLVSTVRHPVLAGRSQVRAFHAMFGPEYARQLDETTRASSTSQLMTEAGRYRSPIDAAGASLSEREEEFASAFLDKVPVVGHIIRASNRHFATYLNQMRDGIEKQVLNGWDEQDRTPEKLIQLASWMNHSTGRGDMPAFLSQYAPALNTGFFSPRYRVAQVQMHADMVRALGRAATAAAKRETLDPVSKEIASSALAFYGTGLTVLGAMKLAGVDVGLVSTASNFGQFLVDGTWYDYWGGASQDARLIAQLATGKRTSATTGDVYRQGRGATVLQYVRSKLSPIPSVLVDVLVGKDMKGRPATFMNELEQLLAPMVSSDIRDAWQADKRFGILGPGTASSFGVGVNTIEPSPLGADFATLPREEKQARIAENPEAAAQVRAERLEAGGAIAARERAIAQRDDQLAAIPRNAPKVTYREAVNRIEQNYLAVRKANEETFPDTRLPSTDPKEKALSAYYDAITELPDGTVDWDATDAKRAQLESSWTAAQRAHVDKETGAVDPNLPPQVRELKQLRKDLERSGYFDIAETAWGALRSDPQGAQLLGNHRDYYAWRDATMAQLTQRALREGAPPGAANELARRAVENTSVAKAYSRLKNRLETQFVIQHVQDGLADDAIEWGYIKPTKAELGATIAGSR